MRNLFLFSLLIFTISTYSQTIIWDKQGRSIVFTLVNGQLSTASLHKIRLTPYGDHIIRVQTVRGNEDFFADNHYEMVEKHDWPGEITVKETDSTFEMTTLKNALSISLNKEALTLKFSRTNQAPLLEELSPTIWHEDTITARFHYKPAEHFTGLGHGYFGRAESIDLKGKIIQRNYGTEHSQQAPLIVPFFISSRGYGVFLNSSILNQFNFGKENRYEFSLTGDGRMDYFFILGPRISDVLDRYTQLTGRPRLPLKAFFGLALSDKGNDHNSKDPSDEQWWKNKITAHRKAGFALDHIVNDNRWRAGGGQRCVSRFEWDPSRYPDPAEYAAWIRNNGLIATLDLNRCIAGHSEAWKPSFNLPETKGIEFNTSAPDLTKKEVRDWFWNLFWNKSLNPSLNYPGDALWIDEFDEMGKAPLSMKFENGSTWLEMKNYWFFLVAKSLVQQGWDKSFKGTKRPFVWVRGMTAGGQRYATLWSGDIKCNFGDMKSQVRGLQLAGLSGFPFWGHDAGGFYLDNDPSAPNDTIYRQWSMAFGSFTPFWKPHGVGKSRWPVDRSMVVQKDALLFTRLRYELIPYIYTYARQANNTGIPIARAMVIDYQEDSLAWKADLQYMWGREFLVAPNCTAGEDVQVWLPPGEWFDFWTDQLIIGGRLFQFKSPLGKLPLFVKAGSVIPMANYALSTAFIPSDSLNLHIYPGRDAVFELYEDDGKTENYKNSQEFRTTLITFNQNSFTLSINAPKGNYKGAPVTRAYRIIFHGIEKAFNVSVNGKKYQPISWDKNKKLLEFKIPKSNVSTRIVLKKI